MVAIGERPGSTDGLLAPVPDAPDAPSGRQRGLDGLRGLAVIAVLLFHQGFGWAKGGYLGVSLFFTLSGFLIARLLIEEVERTGGLGLRSFWGRRLRRLVPAALLALLLVCAYGALFATESQRLSLRGDLWASLANVTNWRFMSSGDSYADVFRDPSPVQHFWSLAIEEQFYLVFPLLVAGTAALVAKFGSGPARFRRSLGVVVVVLMSASLAEQLAFASVDRIYYGTDTRVFELLAGVLLACCWTPAVARATSRRRAVGVGGFAVFGLVLALWSTAAYGTSWLFHGGLAGVAGLSVILVVAAMAPGPVRAMGSWRPLVAVGLVSYGLYLYHWPVFLVFDPARTGLQGWALFGVRCAVTAALAVGSYYLLELPFRTGAIGRVRMAPLIWVSALVAVAVAVPLTVPIGDRGQVINSATFAHANDLINQQLAQSREKAAPVEGASAATAPAPTRVYVVGDSNGVLFAGGLALYAERTGMVDVRSAAVMRCPMGDIDRFNWNSPYGVFAVDVNPDCTGVRQRWAADLASWHPDVIVVVSGSADAAPFHLRGTPPGKFLRVTDPAGRDALVRGIDSASRELRELAPDVPQLWLTSPYINRVGWANGTLEDPDGPQVPAYTDAYNEILGELATTTLVATVPWADAFNAVSLTVDAEERPDGVHTTPERISELLDDWFPRIIATRASLLATTSP